jgi:hypothetical protein
VEKTISITDMLQEEVKKGTLIGRLYSKGLYQDGAHFRLTLFKGANYVQDDMSGAEIYFWSDESKKIGKPNSISPGVHFVGYNLLPSIENVSRIDKICLLMGWNPDFQTAHKKAGYFIPVPDTKGYYENRSGANHSLGFYQDAIHSVEVLRGRTFSERIFNPITPK